MFYSVRDVLVWCSEGLCNFFLKTSNQEVKSEAGKHCQILLLRPEMLRSSLFVSSVVVSIKYLQKPQIDSKFGGFIPRELTVIEVEVMELERKLLTAQH